MIWFFLTGMVAGAVGVIMVLMWWIRTHAIKVTPGQMMKDIEEMGRKTDGENPEH